MNKKQLTKKVLENAAKNLSSIMRLEPPIATGKTVKKDSLIAEILGSAAELETGDKLEAETNVVLKVLGIEFVEEGPVAEEKKPTDTKPTEDPPKKKSRSRFVLEYLCDNCDKFPDITEEETQQALVAAGYTKLSERTMFLWIKETREMIEYLKESGKLKE